MTAFLGHVCRDGGRTRVSQCVSEWTLSLREWYILYFIPARFKRPFQIFMSSPAPFFYSLLVHVMWWEECQSLWSFIFKFRLAWGGKYIENFLVKLRILSHNMSNNCKAVCWSNLGVLHCFHDRLWGELLGSAWHSIGDPWG